MIEARVHVTLKNGILDPQGKTVRQALVNLGLEEVEQVRIGKFIQLRFDGVSKAEAKRLAEEACKKLLANPVIEDFDIELIEQT